MTGAPFGPRDPLRFLPLPLLLPGALVLAFAAEDEGRTEEPTEHKLRKAREEGKVAKSAEFTSAVVMLAVTVMLALVGRIMLRGFADMLTFFVKGATEIDVASDLRLGALFARWFVPITAPVLAAAVVAGIAAEVFQVGFLFSTKPITPDVNRIIPRFGRFFRRAFLSGEAFFNLAKNVMKIAVIVAIVFLNVRPEVPRISHLATLPFMVGFGFFAWMTFRIVVEVAVVLLVLSLPDYLFQRWQHLESLKMSRQEVKEERKQYEGDPLIRSRLRERMREIMNRNMLRAVPRADVVITNPTHYAVALDWERESMAAPTVVAKGVDAMAERIREVARDAGVPLVENRPLARALYAEVEIGEAIPEKYYEVMARILADIYRLQQRAV
jgi:flagellar biosynthetic protein FlhB